MAISTRARLTLYFTALFGAMVVALAITAYLLVRNDVYSKLDSGLHVAVDATAMSADDEFDENPIQAQAKRCVMIRRLSRLLIDLAIAGQAPGQLHRI